MQYINTKAGKQVIQLAQGDGFYGSKGFIAYTKQNPHGWVMSNAKELFSVLNENGVTAQEIISKLNPYADYKAVTRGIQRANEKQAVKDKKNIVFISKNCSGNIFNVFIGVF